MTAIPPSPYIWIIAFAGVVLVGSAATYIRHATKLARCIDERCPARWEKFRWRSRSAPRGLAYLVLFDAAAADHPDDPGFEWHLEQARWSIAIFFLAFLLLALAVGRAYPGSP